MKIVVDTNIVFSALLKADSPIGNILLTSHENLDFYAPELLKEELFRYRSKIIKYSKLSSSQLAILEETIIGHINFISESLIAGPSWEEAYLMTKGIDEDDTPFLALAIELKAILWTGDIKLINGIKSRGGEYVLSTSQLKNLLDD